MERAQTLEGSHTGIFKSYVLANHIGDIDAALDLFYVGRPNFASHNLNLTHCG